jgi:hypothetical protein
MAEYQGVQLEDITFRRALFGLFPTYRDSPLRPSFDRLLQAGDASGIQVKYAGVGGESGFPCAHCALASLNCEHAYGGLASYTVHIDRQHTWAQPRRAVLRCTIVVLLYARRARCRLGVSEH